MVRVDDPEATIGDFRRLVAEKLALQPAQVCIVLCGKEFKDDAVPIREYKFQTETVVHVIRRNLQS